LTVESLDDRMVPSMLGTFPAIHAAMVAHHANQSHAHHAQANRARLHARQRAAIAPLVASPPAATAVQPSVAVPASSASAASAPSTPLGSRPGLNAVLPTSDSSQGSASTPTVILNPADVKNGPLAKAGQDLLAIYQQYQQQGAGSTFTPSGAGGVKIEGTKVGIQAHMANGNFTQYIASLDALGMQIDAQDPNTGTVEGMLPISQLPAAAQNSQTLSLSAIYTPNPQAMIH